MFSSAAAALSQMFDARFRGVLMLGIGGTIALFFGLLFGLQRGLDWATTGRIASLMGAIKIEQHGTQNHRIGFTDFAARYRDTFGTSL